MKWHEDYCYSIQLIHDIVESTGLFVHCLPMPLDSVSLYQILHAVAEVVGHPHHHIKTFSVPCQSVLIKKSLHNLPEHRRIIRNQHKN